MAFLEFDKIKIKGISACAPKKVIKNIEQINLFDTIELEKYIKNTGVIERRIAESYICASDLSYEAANHLLNELHIDRSSIDLLIFVSQTPDYRMPATSNILQHRLGLLKQTGAFDINLGCSGYVYGLSVAYSFLQQPRFNRVLLLVGETLSKIVSGKDRTTSLLFGDAGSATIIEKTAHSCKSYFSLYADGSGYNVLKIPAGGYRYPSSRQSLLEKEDSEGNVKTDEQLFMDGMEVFNFTIREIPDAIHELLTYSNQTLNQIDYIIFHQANKFINDFLTKKLKYPISQVPSSLSKFGNTSCASIPVTIVSELQHVNIRNVLLSGFGIGLSWANAIVELSDCYVSDIIEV